MQRTVILTLLALFTFTACSNTPPLTEGQVKTDIAAVSDRFKVVKVEITPIVNNNMAYKVIATVATYNDKLNLLYEFDNDTKKWSTENIKLEIRKMESDFTRVGKRMAPKWEN